MPPVLLKDVWVEIRHSLGRFLSILLIVALGVAFFAGIKASAPDMKHSADTYFDKYNVQDIQVYSTIGFEKDDVKKIADLPGVETAQGNFSIDALTKKGSTEQVVKVISWQDGQKLNVPRLVEGRLPSAPDECLIEADSVNNELFGSYMPGDRIELYSGNDQPLDDSLKYSTYIIVGKAYNPNYLSYEKGTSSIGSGSVDTFIYVPEEAVKADYWTEIDVAVSGARSMDTYSDAYFDAVAPVVSEIEDIAADGIQARIASQQKQVDDARQEMDEKLADGKKQLDEGKEELDKAWGEIASGLKEIQNGKDKLASSKAELDAGWKTYNENEAAVTSGLAQVDDGIAQLEALPDQIAALKEQKTQLELAKELMPVLDQVLPMLKELRDKYGNLSPDQIPDLGLPEGILPDNIGSYDLDGLIAALESVQNRITSSLPEGMDVDTALVQMEEGITQMETAYAGLADLRAKRTELENAQKELAGAYRTLVSAQAQYESGQVKLEVNEEKLVSGQKEYESGKAEYDKNAAKFDKEKADAEKQVDEAQEKIDSLDGEWIVLDRDSHYSYRDYESCAQRMDGIASVFPVFFYLVAALVCMTTMTRMVQEERNEIGTLKALGYSKVQIAVKYLLYAGSASIAGCILGCAVGMVVFPWIIYSAWNTMYNLEAIHFVFQPGLVLLASGTVTGIVLVATIYSIYRELMEVPSQLMRPKAGKAGKKILLERVPVLWQKIPFMHKVTLRNLFRYKKRFFMTVIGIAGCSALLVAGFGLNDSISDIVPAQFEDIYHYDGTVTADKDVQQELKAIPNIADVYEQQILPVTIRFDKKDVAANLNILENTKQFKKFMTFLPVMGSDENMELDDKGVFISIKTAQKMGLKIGDEITFETADNQKITAPVTGIFDQYIDHQIYVTQKLFDSWKVKEKPNRSYLVIENATDSETEAQTGAKAMEIKGVKGISFYSGLQENFLNMISSIKMVVVVLVLSAAMLAFVVLYNLANVSISERMREIATIKVLGFTEKEINSYVNRESLVMAIVGGIAGLFVGIYLHDLIMGLAELDNIRFGRTINPGSFAISLGLTLLFALAVNWVMKFKLRKVQMVESLKAVE